MVRKKLKYPIQIYSLIKYLQQFLIVNKSVCCSGITNLITISQSSIYIYVFNSYYLVIILSFVPFSVLFHWSSVYFAESVLHTIFIEWCI